MVLKRYYNFLWKNFPQDHLVSLGRFCKLVPLSDDIVDLIVSSSSPDEGNQKLLNICVVTIVKDKALLTFCDLVDKIIDNPKLSKIMKIFRDGERPYHVPVRTKLCATYSIECEEVVNKSSERTLTSSLATGNDQTALRKDLPPSSGVHSYKLRHT